MKDNIVDETRGEEKQVGEEVKHRDSLDERETFQENTLSGQEEEEDEEGEKKEGQESMKDTSTEEGIHVCVDEEEQQKEERGGGEEGEA